MAGMPTTPTQWCLIGRLNADGSILRRVRGSHHGITVRTAFNHSSGACLKAAPRRRVDGARTRHD